MAFQHHLKVVNQYSNIGTVFMLCGYRTCYVYDKHKRGSYVGKKYIKEQYTIAKEVVTGYEFELTTFNCRIMPYMFYNISENYPKSIL